MNPLTLLASLASGLLFGGGLALSGMTRPQKVLGFLDVLGAWDGSLLFVLGGAVTIATLAFHFILGHKKPVLAERFSLPDTRAIDGKLIAGAAIFGIGWGAAGYCPGPAIALLAHPNIEALYFLPSMIAGWWIYRRTAGRTQTRP
ncbi:hypothetical protein F4827_003853 [Paraburkholderia bannensis]|uniref:YeeE/YedE family protein n=1 Tax=Paraburkholderia bannensis TaxID=765414 RepID=A0A7W9WTV3_9BURK|nr:MULTISPECIES: DUF6691 family protein [Paraburkholderia]MBB3258980.1 hypothetical protein [Paraburkholderia sp. WP4_3_2]MBB6103994.1 hypothetical protein [Paraburkholderia bannensis]